MAQLCLLDNPWGMAKGRAPSDIGRRLENARKERGISQSALARELGVTRSAINQWISGVTSPSTQNLAEAALVLRVSADWLATGRGERSVEPAVITPRVQKIRQVPLVSWVSAGRLADSSSQVPVQEAQLIPFANLGRGEFFALRVQGDSMDRISPEGSIIIVNREDRSLIHGKPYIFSMFGEVTYKLWEPDPPHLAPFSTNPANKPIFINRKRDLEVIGRVRRSLIDL